MLVAVMVTTCEESTAAGAVYNPLDKLPTDGVMDQFTPVSELPVTIAANCKRCTGASTAVAGLMLTLTLVGRSSTTALADLEGSATLVAMIVTDCETVMSEGAVYNPFAKVPTAGVMDQVTAAFESPTTLAVNCELCDGARAAFMGLMLMLTALPVGTS